MCEAPTSPVIMTVTGFHEASRARVADAHCHLWIQPVVEESPDLTDEEGAVAELNDFGSLGGDMVLDCQPIHSGRDTRVLLRLAQRTRVAIVASTGFHLRKYYPDGIGPWAMAEGQAKDLFVRELQEGTEECREVRAGSIKTAWTGDGGREDGLMSEAIAAAVQCQAPITVHTEQGQRVERLITLLEDADMEPGRVQLSHLDKRPDQGLHGELARAGYVLGYDTFLRPKYDPEHNVWPLLRFMIESTLWRQVAIGLDASEASLWHAHGGSGLRSIPTAIRTRLASIGASPDAIEDMTGRNIARVLSGRGVA